MELTFFGAAHEVTGSCSLLEIGKTKILVDCGMEQGADIYENQKLSVNPALLDFVLLTHAHIDHSGLLPLLAKNGFRGVVYTTEATKDLCRIMLADSAHIQEFEAEWRNRKAKRAGGPDYVPLYTQADVDTLMSRVVGVGYGKEFELENGIFVRFEDAGHLLGSACAIVTATDNGKPVTVVFSGDLGKKNKPILHDFTPITSADYVVIESTYGDRDHDPECDRAIEVAHVIATTLPRGNVVIPSFAVGRTQELLYLLHRIKEQNLVGFDFDVYVDSPLAVEATSVFNNNTAYCLDDAMVDLLSKGVNPLQFPGLYTSVTTDQSKALNAEGSKGKVILSASGMCEAGRIRHHLKHNLWNPDSTIMFVGYQVAGTLGAAILGGAKKVKLFGEEINVKARIVKLQGSSSHADRTELAEWLSNYAPKPKRVFVNHGDCDACEAFRDKVEQELGIPATAPYSGEKWDLSADVCKEAGNHTKKTGKTTAPVAAPSKQSQTYRDLLSASRQLQDLIDDSADTANGELRKLTEEINDLIAKYK